MGRKNYKTGWITDIIKIEEWNCSYGNVLFLKYHWLFMFILIQRESIYIHGIHVIRITDKLHKQTSKEHSIEHHRLYCILNSERIGMYAQSMANPPRPKKWQHFNQQIGRCKDKWFWICSPIYQIENMLSISRWDSCVDGSITHHQERV